MAEGVDKLSFVKDMVIKETQDIRDRVFNELVILPSQDRKQLPEEIFVREFLPYFRGEPVPEGRPNMMATWIGIAGSATAEVTIMDEKGQPLFNIPPVLDTTFLSAKRSDNVLEHYDRIVDHSNLIANNLPQEATVFLENALTNKINGMVVDRPSMNMQSRWEAIFKRYYAPVEEVADTSSDPEQSPLADEEY